MTYSSIMHVKIRSIGESKKKLQKLIIRIGIEIPAQDRDGKLERLGW